MLWNSWRDPTALVALVQPSPSDERCDRQIVMVLTFRGTENIAARARIRSTSFFTSWNCQRDLCRVISLLHDSSGTISMECLQSLRSKEHCPPTSDLCISQIEASTSPRAYPAHLTPFLAWEEGNLITNRRGWGIWSLASMSWYGSHWLYVGWWML